MNDVEAVRMAVNKDPKLVISFGSRRNVLAEFAGNGNTDGVRHLWISGLNVGALYTNGDPYLTSPKTARRCMWLHGAHVTRPYVC